MIHTALIVVGILGSVADVEAALHDTLQGGPASAAGAQAVLSQTLGWSFVSQSGVVVSGREPRVQDLEPADLAVEVGANVPIQHYFRVSGRGPAPLRVHVPIHRGSGRVKVLRRIEPGLFVRLAKAAVRRQHLSFELSWPGEFVTLEVGGDRSEDAKLLFPEYPPASSDPELKRYWRLYRVGAAELVGPIPLVLIHGAGTDRWDEFVHWARFSPEADELRQQYQLWNFSHNMWGINAAIGYSPDFPMFEESIVAYLNRFMNGAIEDGVVSEGGRHYFPEGPFSMLTNSHGALKARAFMINFPEYGDRVLGVVTLGGPHMGTPWATPEWIRYTASGLGLLKPNWAELLAEDAISSNYVSTQNQSDLDMAWPNYDAQGGFGLPYAHYTAWSCATGVVERVISPRDANQTGARDWHGYEDDTTFDPPELLETYCGGFDAITPVRRGEGYMDRFFLYGSYIIRAKGWLQLLCGADDGVMESGTNRFENTALRITNILMGLVETPGAGWPSTTYRMTDGFVPLQSQLMLDGTEIQPVYETCETLGWRVPILPLRPNMDVIREHTLADPDRLRILPGWSHLDIVTGRYNQKTLHSELFMMVADDLLSVLPARE